MQMLPQQQQQQQSLQYHPHPWVTTAPLTFPQYCFMSSQAQYMIPQQQLQSWPTFQQQQQQRKESASTDADRSWLVMEFRKAVEEGMDDDRKKRVLRLAANQKRPTLPNLNNNELGAHYAFVLAAFETMATSEVLFHFARFCCIATQETFHDLYLVKDETRPRQKNYYYYYQKLEKAHTQAKRFFGEMLLQEMTVIDQSLRKAFHELLERRQKVPYGKAQDLHASAFKEEFVQEYKFIKGFAMFCDHWEKKTARLRRAAAEAGNPKTRQQLAEESENADGATPPSSKKRSSSTTSWSANDKQPARRRCRRRVADNHHHKGDQVVVVAKKKDDDRDDDDDVEIAVEICISSRPNVETAMPPVYILSFGGGLGINDDDGEVVYDL